MEPGELEKGQSIIEEVFEAHKRRSGSENLQMAKKKKKVPPVAEMKFALRLWLKFCSLILAIWVH